MAYIVETTDGHQVLENKTGTDEQAKADVADRNKRAEEMGIKTRYRVRES